MDCFWLLALKWRKVIFVSFLSQLNSLKRPAHPSQNPLHHVASHHFQSCYQYPKNDLQQSEPIDLKLQCEIETIFEIESLFRFIFS